MRRCDQIWRRAQRDCPGGSGRSRDKDIAFAWPGVWPGVALGLRPTRSACAHACGPRAAAIQDPACRAWVGSRARPRDPDLHRRSHPRGPDTGSTARMGASRDCRPRTCACVPCPHVQPPGSHRRGAGWRPSGRAATVRPATGRRPAEPLATRISKTNWRSEARTLRNSFCNKEITQSDRSPRCRQSVIQVRWVFPASKSAR